MKLTFWSETNYIMEKYIINVKKKSGEGRMSDGVWGGLLCLSSGWDGLSDALTFEQKSE